MRIVRCVVVGLIAWTAIDGSLVRATANEGPSGISVSAQFFDGAGLPIAVTVQADGRIVAVGRVLQAGASDTDFAVMRFHQDGTPDGTFGMGGRVTTDFSGTNDSAHAIAIQDDGKILVGGSTTLFLDPLNPTAPTLVAAFARYTPTGSPDASFGVGGKTAAACAVGPGVQPRNIVSAVAVAPDARIYAAIETLDIVHNIAHRLFRYSTSGTFEADLNVPSQSLRSRHPLAFGSDGRLTTLGMNEAVQSSSMRGRASRYLMDGTPDPSFGGGVGYVDGLSGNGLIVQSDTKPVIVGSGVSVARLTTGGALDGDFNQAGVVIAGFGASAVGEARSVTFASDGSIIAAGSTDPYAGSTATFFSSGGDFAVLITSGAGTIRQRVVADFGGDDYALAVRTLGDGTVITAGLSRQPTQIDVVWNSFMPNRWRPLPVVPLAPDFNGDRQTDMVILSSRGEWRVVYPSLGSEVGDVFAWGLPSDAPVLADFDGDGRSELVVYRPPNGSSVTGTWYAINPHTLAQSTYQWGLRGDMPVPADFDGDGRTDLAVWRPGTGEWFIYSVGEGQFTHRVWGAYGDTPLPRDYDGDGKADVAIYRPGSGTWYILPSKPNQAVLTLQWGVSTDIPVPGDYDGDGTTEIAIYRPDTGFWWVYNRISGMNISTLWGAPGDQPVPGDYLGNSATDLAIWRPTTGEWFVYDFATSRLLLVRHGAPNEEPLLGDNSSRYLETRGSPIPALAR